MAIYSWTGIASDFPRNQRVYKLRWDTSIVCTDLTAPNGMIAEAPDINCDGINWRDATAATPYAYAGANRFSLTQDFITNRVGDYTNQYFTALTVSTLVSGTTYEVILPSTQAYYWGGLGNLSDYTLGTQKVHLAKEVSALSFPQSGSTIGFVFDEVGAWTYTAPQWLTVTSGAGYSNEVVLTATATANTSTSGLSGNIVFSDGSNTITLPVSQEAKSPGSGGGIYLGGLGISGCYLGTSAIKACYLGSTYIFPQSTLPSVPFLVNYNAKQYDSTTRTFHKTYGQLFDEDLVLDMAPTSYNSDSVSFVGSTARMDKTYSGSSANPFNRNNSTNKTFTMVYKVGTFTGDSKNLFANRDAVNYNYMVRGGCLHTSDSSFLNMIPQSDPYILLVRIKADGSSERSVLDANGNVLQTVTASNVSWGSSTTGVSFFSGRVGGNENFDGIFYWMYLSNEALTDAEVQQVINYNENYI